MRVIMCVSVYVGQCNNYALTVFSGLSPPPPTPTTTYTLYGHVVLCKALRAFKILRLTKKDILLLLLLLLLLPLSGYDNQAYVIPGLLSYWKYSITVQASAPLGASEPEQRTAVTATSGQWNQLMIILICIYIFICSSTLDLDWSNPTIYKNTTITDLYEWASRSAQDPQKQFDLYELNCVSVFQEAMWRNGYHPHLIRQRPEFSPGPTHFFGL